MQIYETSKQNIERMCSTGNTYDIVNRLKSAPSRISDIENRCYETDKCDCPECPECTCDIIKVLSIPGAAAATALLVVNRAPWIGLSAL